MVLFSSGSVVDLFCFVLVLVLNTAQKLAKTFILQK